MKRCVIFGAAEIKNYEKVRKHILPDDFIICADGGLYHTDELNIKPDLIVGDFDSYKGVMPTDIETIRLSTKKDDTDTVFAAREGIKRGYTDFLVFGVIGGRLDHTLGNVYLLEFLNEAGASGKIVDDFSEMFLIIDGSARIYKGEHSYFSVIAVNGKADGVTISGAVFPLTDYTMLPSYQVGISNEFSDDIVEISEIGRAHV